jgi:hypothetical protein
MKQLRFYTIASLLGLCHLFLQTWLAIPATARPLPSQDAAETEARAFQQAYDKMKEARARGGQADLKELTALVGQALGKRAPAGNRTAPFSPRESDEPPIVNPASVPKFLEFKKHQ